MPRLFAVDSRTDDHRLPLKEISAVQLVDGSFDAVGTLFDQHDVGQHGPCHLVNGAVFVDRLDFSADWRSDFTISDGSFHAFQLRFLDGNIILGLQLVRL